VAERRRTRADARQSESRGGRGKDTQRTDDEYGYDDRQDNDYDEYEEETQAPGSGGGPSEELSAAQAARAGLRQVAELTAKNPAGVTSVEPAEEGWVVGVEVIEDRRVPSSADIMAIYEATIDMAGSLVSYRRTRRYPRGRGDDDGVR
jgi:hypothetical protein